MSVSPTAALHAPPAVSGRIFTTACAGVVLVFALAGRTVPAAQPPVPALTVSAVAVGTATIARTVPVTGSIRAWQEVVVGPEVGGYRVEAVNVEVGDTVRRGQELVRLSDGIPAAEAASRRAALKQAEAQLVNAEAALRRAESLSGVAAFSAAEVDRLRSEQLAAAARVEAARADLALAELRLQYTRVRAPHDGIVTSRTVNVGEVAQTGSEMLRLLRDGRLEWRGEVPEAHLKSLRVGQTARLATADGTELKGTVRIVAPTVAESDRMGQVYVDLAPGAAARPGMFARGVIETAEAEALFVPLAAVVAQDGYSYVYVIGEGDRVQRRRVQTGSLQGDRIEIREGVAAGERIVARGAAFLKDGDFVRVVAAS